MCQNQLTEFLAELSEFSLAKQYSRISIPPVSWTKKLLGDADSPRETRRSSQETAGNCRKLPIFAGNYRNTEKPQMGVCPLRSVPLSAASNNPITTLNQQLKPCRKEECNPSMIHSAQGSLHSCLCQILVCASFSHLLHLYEIPGSTRDNF